MKTTTRSNLPSLLIAATVSAGVMAAAACGGTVDPNGSTSVTSNGGTTTVAVSSSVTSNGGAGAAGGNSSSVTTSNGGSTAGAHVIAYGDGVTDPGTTSTAVGSTGSTGNSVAVTTSGGPVPPPRIHVSFGSLVLSCADPHDLPCGGEVTWTVSFPSDYFYTTNLIEFDDPSVSVNTSETGPEPMDCGGTGSVGGSIAGYLRIDDIVGDQLIGELNLPMAPMDFSGPFNALICGADPDPGTTVSVSTVSTVTTGTTSGGS